MKTKSVAAMVALLVLVFSFSGNSHAGDMPADSERLHARLSGRIQPSVRSWINMEANTLRGFPAIDESRLRADIAARFKGQNPGPNDILEIAFLVMMQATRDADSDLKAIMEKTKANNESRRKLREKTERQKARTTPDNAGRSLDSMNETGEINSLRLQTAKDRRSKCIETLSNIMKKMSTTEDTVIRNLK